MNTIERVRRVVAKELKRPEAEIGDHAHLNNDLQADSLSMIEIAMGVEEEFDVEVTDDEAEAACTVTEIATLVDSKLKGRILG